MSLYSEMMGSFIRTGNYPLEANYIFESEAALKEFYSDPILKATLHKGLLKVVQDGTRQWLYWVVEQGGELVWQKYVPITLLSQDVTATNVTVGNIKNGDTLPAGMSFTEFVIKMLITPKSPTYSVSSISNLSSPIEIGTSVDGAIGTFVINQGGPINNATAAISGFLEATKPTVTFSGNTVNIAFTGRIAAGNNTVSSTVNYDQGAVFLEIAAGALTSSRTIVGARKFFFGQGIAPVTSAGIRANTGVLLTATYSHELAAGLNNMWLAIPSTNKLTEVKDAGALNALITGNFKEAGTVNVDGATAGKDTISYTIYQLTGYGPFGDIHTMNFKFN